MTQLEVLRMGRRGEAVAEAHGKPIYIPFALPGEAVEAEIDGDRGALREVIAASPDRVEPLCKHFGLCGGCLLQHWRKDAYRAWKRSLVATALERAGLAVETGEVIDAGGAGRRRVTIHGRGTGAGFMRLRSHQLENIDHCPILVPALSPAFEIARAVAALAGDCDVALTASENGLDVMVKASRRVNGLKLAPLVARFGLARLSLNGETMLEALPSLVSMGKAQVKLPVASFLQATEAGEAVLARLVAGHLKKARRIADLFCGMGPFALRLAEHASIAAVDSDRAALDALEAAARRTQGLKPIAVHRRDLYREPLIARELNAFDGVVFDPPRAGAEAQARELARSSVRRVVAVSCDATTFARDASILVAGGYRLSAVTPVDQFLWSPHVEIVGDFVR
ncbi:MAG: class I SAM-dependent RNA methyltransferase [Rhizobiales bacterium]|nr:class I SAM-dependent RNA methyltransferase [Hyphomicrobiales bacterium]